MILDGLKADCPKCGQEGLFTPENIRADAPLLCPNPECQADLTVLQPRFRQGLSEAEEDIADTHERQTLAHDILDLWRSRLEDDPPIIH